MKTRLTTALAVGAIGLTLTACGGDPTEGEQSATDTITRENDHAIRTAPGADAPVDPALRDTGLAGLCRRAAYRGDPKCVQHADPR